MTLDETITKTPDVFTSREISAAAPEFTMKSICSRLRILEVRGFIRHVEWRKYAGSKPIKVYRAQSVAPEPFVTIPLQSKPVVQGQTLREVRWHSELSRWQERMRPSLDPIPACPSLLELLQLLSAYPQEKKPCHQARTM